MAKEATRRAGAIGVGFVTIAFLSSTWARLQAGLFPASTHLFDDPAVVDNAGALFALKLISVLSCCVFGGALVGRLSAWNRAPAWVGALVSLVVGYLWLIAARPAWFWSLLLLGVLPCVEFGSRLARKRTVRANPDRARIGAS